MFVFGSGHQFFACIGESCASGAVAEASKTVSSVWIGSDFNLVGSSVLCAKEVEKGCWGRNEFSFPVIHKSNQ